MSILKPLVSITGLFLMKKALLPLIVASTFALPAMAEVIVYGKANVSLQNADEADASKMELVSNASRIGLKGGEQINDSLKAIYQFEYQTEVDDGANGSNNQTFGQRNIYVGLQGSGGTIIGGKFDTPVKAAQEKVDLFNDLEGDIAFLVDGETRINNIVQYTSPLFADKKLAVNVAHVSAENASLDDGKSVSVTYTGSAFYAALATEQDVTAQGLDITRLVGRYNWKAIQLGMLVEQSDGDLDEYEADAWLASFKYSATDKLALKAQYGDAGIEVLEQNVVVNEDATQANLGVDYLLSKNTMIFGYYTQEEIDGGADDSWFGVGMELKF
jgi:predicted porin